MKRTNTTIRRSEYRAGFTLVEMLISVTLVLLMMTMFTAIFQMATDSISKQRSIAENDQRARAVTTSIRADIAKRSFQYVLPFYPSEVSDTSPTDFGNRAGYIYISTNDPDSWQDDLLQFTVDINQTAEDPDDTLVFGSAELFYDLGSDPDFDSGGGRTRNTTLRFNVNQPDADDGNLLANGVGASSAAEVCYFVRNGNLYRRVMLLREPLSVAGEDLSLEPRAAGSDNEFIAALPAATGSTNDFGGVFTYVSTPQAINQVDSGDPDHFRLAGGDSVPSSWGVRASNDFWRHFDYSAFPTLQLGASAGVFLPDDLAFNGTDSLDNGLGAVPRLGVPVVVAPSLGDPHHRFGFNFRTGLSREHDNPTELQFIGRFTHAETSHPDFNWPLAATRQGSVTNIPLPSSPSAVAALNTGTLRGNGNPMDLVGTPLSLNQSTGVLTEFAGTTGRGGPRMVEDLLLANVHGMKVEIWDTRLQRFVQPNNSTLTQVLNSGGGLSTIAGDYHSTRNLNPTFGPRGAAATASNRVFDTWNPQVAGGTTPPPFIPYRYYPPRRNDTPPGPSPNAMADPTTEVDRETGLATNRGYWTPSDFSDADPGNWTYQNYSVGDVVFAAVQFDGDSPDEIFEWDQDIIQPQAFQIAYRCIGAGYAGWSGDYSPTLQQPSWPRVPGQVIQEEQNPLANNTGGPNNPATWIAVDNRQPLESIKVTFQLYDVKTESLRQLSLVLPLTTDR